jgi:hypothetical protein
MAKTADVWAARVAEWRASGQTSTGYCEGKPFTAGGLRHWAYRLCKGAQRQPQSPPIRVARVLRRPAVSSDSRRPSAGVAAGPTPTPEPLVVECGAMRVAVRPGFDRATLAAVLEVIAVRGGGR